MSEEFKKWVSNYDYTPWERQVSFITWQHQQSRIDELEQENAELRAQLGQGEAVGKVSIPFSLLLSAIGLIEDRMRYGEEGTIHQVWRDLKAIQNGVHAPQSKPLDERKAFEASFNGDANFERNPSNPEYYLHSPTRRLWKAWQARAALGGSDAE